MQPILGQGFLSSLMTMTKMEFKPITDICHARKYKLALQHSLNSKTIIFFLKNIILSVQLVELLIKKVISSKYV